MKTIASILLAIAILFPTIANANATAYDIPNGQRVLYLDGAEADNLEQQVNAILNNTHLFSDGIYVVAVVSQANICYVQKCRPVSENTFVATIQNRLSVGGEIVLKISEQQGIEVAGFRNPWYLKMFDSNSQEVTNIFERLDALRQLNETKATQETQKVKIQIPAGYRINA